MSLSSSRLNTAVKNSVVTKLSDKYSGFDANGFDSSILNDVIKIIADEVIKEIKDNGDVTIPSNLGTATGLVSPSGPVTGSLAIVPIQKGSIS